MDLQLDGQTAFVSGSTQGIGYAIAEDLVREGAHVVVNGREQHRVDDAVSRLRSIRPEARVSGLVADLGAADELGALTASLGEIDILVNNVGIFGIAAFQDVPDAEWQRYIDVNLMSGVRLSRHVLPGMLARNRGRIIFVNSESGVNVPSDMLPYGVSKAASLALANGLAKLTRGTAVTVNTILGGPTYSDGVAGSIAQIAESQSMSSDDLKAMIMGGHATTLLQRFIDPREISSLALYLASPLSSATNGAALRADGGALTSLT
ncbi:SDR family NAD(P)-dependent oxidoreductase [Aeromicrobium endophyticum]|uniref:SDR family NAD(P)-dependent oxidoreductase n=1 Tax=Aeromicrobium endophyticum TaxID=2292704 RepID=A0A371P3P6_9ACTN|nr:SDR family oxidoreductase [Aeromicrobium endophyticum]REK70552.1 SDR family NAD(P)-dependent oxidoreductase [Aeromicrobium endophyticum]